MPETPAHLPTHTERIAARMASFQQAYQTLVEVTKSGSRIERRDAIQKFEDALLTLPQVTEKHLSHKFVNKMYWRERLLLKGEVHTTMIHKEDGISVILTGIVVVITEEIAVRIIAPAMFETKAGTKRIIFVEEDCLFNTVHPNPSDCRDIEALEERLATTDFSFMEVL